jgi:hypothetical protein
LELIVNTEAPASPLLFWTSTPRVSLYITEKLGSSYARRGWGYRLKQEGCSIGAKERDVPQKTWHRNQASHHPNLLCERTVARRREELEKREG